MIWHIWLPVIIFSSKYMVCSLFLKALPPPPSELWRIQDNDVWMQGVVCIFVCDYFGIYNTNSVRFNWNAVCLLVCSVNAVIIKYKCVVLFFNLVWLVVLFVSANAACFLREVSRNINEGRCIQGRLNVYCWKMMCVDLYLIFLRISVGQYNSKNIYYYESWR